MIGPITVGDRSLVGVGSVVTHDVPAGAVVAGVPAANSPRDADRADDFPEFRDSARPLPCRDDRRIEPVEFQNALRRLADGQLLMLSGSTAKIQSHACVPLPRFAVDLLGDFGGKASLNSYQVIRTWFSGSSGQVGGVSDYGMGFERQPPKSAGAASARKQWSGV